MVPLRSLHRNLPKSSERSSPILLHSSPPQGRKKLDGFRPIGTGSITILVRGLVHNAMYVTITNPRATMLRKSPSIYLNMMKQGRIRGRETSATQIHGGPVLRDAGNRPLRMLSTLIDNHTLQVCQDILGPDTTVDGSQCVDMVRGTIASHHQFHTNSRG